MSTPLRVLILEDSPTDAGVMVRHLREAGYAPDWRRVETEAEFLAHLGPTLELILIDYTLPGFDGRRALQMLRERGCDIPAIIVTGTIGEGAALDCLRLGAVDYLLKDRLARLGQAVRSALAHRTLQHEQAAAGVAWQAGEAPTRCLADVLEKSLQPFGVVYPDGHIGLCNAALWELLGYSEAELRALDWSRDLAPPESRAIEAERLAELLRTGQPVRYERESLRKDGTRVPVELLVHLVRAAADGPPYYWIFVMDLTERKRAEQVLRMEQDRLARLTEASPVGMTVVNRGGQITFANTAAERVLGLARDEIAQRAYNAPAWRITTYDGAPLPDEELPFCQVMITGQPVYAARHAIEWPDGHRVLLSIDATPVFDEAGHPDGMIATVEDVTRQVLAEREHRETRELLTSLLDHAPVTIYAASAEGRLQLVNRKWEALVGLGREDVIGRTLDEVFSPEIARQYQAVNQQVVEAVAPIVAEEFFDDSNGRHFFHTVKFPLHGTASRVESIGGMSIDITERKRAEDELRESEARYRSLFENSLDGVLLTAPDGRILAANREACRILGRTEDELRQVGRARVVDVTDPRLAALLEERSRTGKCRGELTHLRGDGARFEGEISSAVFKDKDGAPRTSMVIRDITDRKRAEEALRQRTRQLEVVHAVTAEIARELEPTTLLRLITRRAAGLVGVGSGTVWLWGEATQRLVPKAWHGSADWRDEVRFRLGEGVAGTAAQRREGLIVNDYRSSPYAHPLLLERTDVTAVLGEPLIYRDRLLGVLTIDNTGSGRLFTDQDREIVALFAGQAAIAIENARLFQSVSEQHTQLRNLTARLADAGEMQRQRLSRELHDCVGGNLTALNLNLSIVRNQLLAEETSSATARIEDCLRLAEEATQHIRRVMTELRPPLLDDQGLVAALRWYSDQFSARTSVATTVRGEDPRPRLSRSAEIALFRIAQEVLTNVAKHAQAGEVSLTFEETAEKVRLTIADDGVGFDPATVRTSEGRARWGLITMRERAVAIGGSLRLESAPGNGTRVIVEVPR